MKHGTKQLIRVLGVLLGLFLVCGAVLDIAGLEPSSVIPAPSLVARTLRSAPSFLAGLFLIIRFRWLTTAARFFPVAAGLLAACFWYSWSGMLNLRALFAGRKSVAILPVTAVLLAILWSNFWILARAHSQPGRRTA